MGRAKVRFLPPRVACLFAVLAVVGCSDDASPTPDDVELRDDGGGAGSGDGDVGKSDAGKDDAGLADAAPSDAGATRADGGDASVTDTFAICAKVVGLDGATGEAGLEDAGAGGLALQLDADGVDAASTLEVTEDGTHCFETAVPSGAPYAVRVEDAPTNPLQSCTVTGASGTVTEGEVSSVTVNCDVDRFTIGGTTTGLESTVVLSLRDEGGTEIEEIPLNSNGAYASSPQPSGLRYQLVVETQPTFPLQTCVVGHPNGQVRGADVTNAKVTCTTQRFTVSGTVQNHGGAFKLWNDGGDEYDVAAGATSFTFATSVPSGQDYAVAVPVPPTNGACLVTNGSGPIIDAAITNVIVECTITEVFALTGAMQTFTVPTGVTSVTLDVYGAQGAPGGHDVAPPETGGAGGLGANATGTLAVSAGLELYVFVGGAGVGSAAGFNGGGNGGVGDIADPLGVGGGGGGASDVRLGGTTLAQRIITAGGGGGGGGAGSGGSCNVALLGGVGGPGGGGNGGNGENASGAGGGGSGAIGSTAGTKGTGCATFLGSDGTSGAPGVGGDGGAGQACCCAMDPSGGGGGGGFVGGGGGGGASAGSVGCFGSGKGGGGGGGGGTSNTSGVTAGTTTAGVRASDGEIRISY